MRSMTIEHESILGSHVPSHDYGTGRECQCQGTCGDVNGLGCLTGPGGRRGRCARKISRYSPPQRFGDVTFYLCGACLDSHINLSTDLEKLANSGRGKRGKPGRYLYRLHGVIKSQGRTIAGLAREIQANSRSLEHVVHCKQRCGPEREKKIAEALGVSVEVLR